MMSLLRFSIVGTPMFRSAGGKGGGTAGVATLGMAVEPLDAVAVAVAESMPAFRSMFMSASGSACVGVIVLCGSARCGGGDRIATVAGGG